MIKGLYTAASAMIAAMNEQTVLTHNITNLDTAGFKQVMLSKEDWKKTSVSELDTLDNSDSKLPSYVSSALDNTSMYSIGTIGLGVQTTPESYDFTQGSFETTNEPLDMAIEGDGFFRVSTPNGDRYTRDGRFHLDSNNNLVTVDGYYVLDSNGSRITLSSTDITVKTDGTIEIASSAVAKLGIYSFTDPAVDLQRDENMFIAVGTPIASTDSKVVNNALEASNVDYTEATTKMLQIGRTYEAAQKMVTVQDTLLGKSIAILGKFT